jgi:hypothetical protein
MTTEIVPPEREKIKLPALPTMEQAIAKAEAFIKAKVQGRGRLLSINSFGCNLGMVGQTDIYTVEGNVEVETSPEQVFEAQTDFLGRVKVPQKVIPRQFVSALWKVQLKLDDLMTLGFDLKF